MKIEVGSTWVNKNNLDNTVTVDTVGAFAVTGHSDKDGLYMANIDDFLHYFKPLTDTYCRSLRELSEQEFEKIVEEAYEDGYDSGKNQWQDDYGFTVPNKSIQSLERAAYTKGLKDKGDINKSVEYEEYKKGYEHGVQHMKMQNSIDKCLEMSDKLSLTEDEVDNIIDDAFEEGYAQAYSELQTKTEDVGDLISDAESFGFREGYAQANRERALQEKAWDEGYDQAVYDLIDDGIVDGLDEEDGYSEYEFGDVEDDEEEYCFYKELDRILKSGQEQYEADPSVPSMGNRYDENGKLCGFFINTGNEKIGGINGSERKHSHYFKDVRHLDYIDVYELNKLFPIDDDTDCILHARKKLLVCGGRGGSKDMITDITDARDTLNRYLQIEGIEE